MTGVGSCVRCGRHGLTNPLHGDNGGPLLCPNCYGKARCNIRSNQKGEKRIYEAFGFGLTRAAPNELCQELLDDAVRLCHPDRHPPERAELAGRVTAELLALRPFTKPREVAPVAPQTESSEAPTDNAPPPPSRNASPKMTRRNHCEAVTPAYPCDDCRHCVPRDYCDPCRERWDADRQAERERNAEAQRRYRKQKRQRKRGQCAECGTIFWGRRKDTKFCSTRCRVAAHRTNQTKTPPTGKREALL